MNVGKMREELQSVKLLVEYVETRWTEVQDTLHDIDKRLTAYNETTADEKLALAEQRIANLEAAIKGLLRNINAKQYREDGEQASLRTLAAILNEK